MKKEGKGPPQKGKGTPNPLSPAREKKRTKICLHVPRRGRKNTQGPMVRGKKNPSPHEKENGLPEKSGGQKKKTREEKFGREKSFRTKSQKTPAPI